MCYRCLLHIKRGTLTGRKLHEDPEYQPAEVQLPSIVDDETFVNSSDDTTSNNRNCYRKHHETENTGEQYLLATIDP